MKRHIIIILTVLCAMQGSLLAQDTSFDKTPDPSKELERPSVILPVNLYDSVVFPEAYHSPVRTWMYWFGPGFVTALGLLEWNWFDKNNFEANPTRVFGTNALDGSSDKLGHMYGTYTVKRLSSFLFRATGSSPLRANIEGVIYASTVQFIMEVGDGFSTAQGFDIHDIVFNEIGACIGFILDACPALDRLFAIQWEYVPTRRMLRSFGEFDGDGDIFTDYSGMKFLFVTKFAGIPYVSRTPLRYVNFDLGYYSRGYDNKDFHDRTRHVYIGVSVNYTIAFGDILPAGYTSSTFQSIFNYVHPPLDLEVKNWELSRIPN